MEDSFRWRWECDFHTLSHNRCGLFGVAYFSHIRRFLECAEKNGVEIPIMVELKMQTRYLSASSYYSIRQIGKLFRFIIIRDYMCVYVVWHFCCLFGLVLTITILFIRISRVFFDSGCESLSMPLIIRSNNEHVRAHVGCCRLKIIGTWAECARSGVFVLWMCLSM